jgi:hypothetical protein
MTKVLLLIFSFLFYSILLYADYDVKWANVSGYSYSSSTNSLQKTGGNNWSYATFSHNKLKINTNGKVGYAVTNTTNSYFIGLTPSTSGNYTNIKYAASQTQSNLRVFEDGILIQTYPGVLQTGDSVIVRRTGSSVYYSRIRSNVETVYYTNSAANANQELYAASSIWQQNALLASVKSSFGYIDCNASLTHIDPQNNILTGSISISGVSGAVGYYSMTWSSGGIGTYLSNLQAGVYTLTIVDALGAVEVREFKVGYLTKWVGVSGYSYNSSSNNISKTSGNNSWNDGVGISANKLKSGLPGCVKYRVESINDNKQRYFGLADHNTAPSYSSVKYEVMTYNNNFYIHESGSFVHSRAGLLEVGDELEVERDGVNVYYNRIRNGKKWRFYTSTTNVNLNEDLFADIGFYVSGTSMNNVVTSFEVPIDLTANVIHIDIPNNIQGSIDLMVGGSSGPYSYSWSNGENTEDISVAHQGEHSVTVTDQFGYTNSLTVRVDYLVKWDYTDGLLYDEVNNILEKTSASNSWGNNGASSCNQMSNSFDGRVSYKIESLDQRFFGLAESNQNNWYSFNDHSIWHANNRFRIYEKATYKGDFGSVAVGDVVTIERLGTTVYYKIKRVGNDEITLFTTSNVDNTKTLYADASIYYNGTKTSEVLASYPCRVFSNYIKPKKKIDGAIHLPTNNKLYIAFDEVFNTNNSSLILKVIDESTNEYVQNNLNVISLGDNRHEVNLNDFNSTIVSGYYVLEIENNKKEKRYLRFKI